MAINRDKFKIYAGVGLMTVALLFHLAINLNPNNTNRQVAINDFKKISAAKGAEEDKTDKKRGR
ncbi:MAG: hypothetical protein E7161_03910 [Firmicutes bacterium]|nr:hypothetical protein [Bacillota bacterium]